MIAATNRDLESEVEQPRAPWKPLYFRLSTVTLNIPPLRERKADLLLLAESLSRAVCRKTCMGSPSSGQRMHTITIGLSFSRKCAGVGRRNASSGCDVPARGRDSCHCPQRPHCPAQKPTTQKEPGSQVMSLTKWKRNIVRPSRHGRQPYSCGGDSWDQPAKVFARKSESWGCHLPPLINRLLLSLLSESRLRSERNLS